MQGNSNKPAPTKLTFGFDIGIASVGWAVLSEHRIVDLGVRAFDKAETAKEGDPLNLARRTARLTRHRLHHRAIRLRKLVRLLVEHKLIADTNFFHPVNPVMESLWELRVAGLDRLLTQEEWARVIYHINKHRGFHWYSRAEEAKTEDDKSEGGRVKKGLKGTKKLMAEKGHRTVAEMACKEFDTQRNKHGDYGKALSRVQLAEELQLLFKHQRTFQNPFAGQQIELAILGTGDQRSGLFWEQKPALSGASLLKMLGMCTFEKAEFRAPKAAFTAERHVWLTRLNNLRISIAGEQRALTEVERKLVLNLPYQSPEKFTYKHLRKELEKHGLSKDFRFNLSYPASALEAGRGKDPESEALVKLSAWHDLKKKLKDKNLEAEWQKISVPALEGQPEVLNQIAWILSVYKEDEEAKNELAKLPLPASPSLIDSLLEVRFDKFHSLSLKALRKIVPLMEAGLRYDEACQQADYHHSMPNLQQTADKAPLLPSLYTGRDQRGSMELNKDLDPPRNPVVLRSINQARKVLNALVKKYGAPMNVHIELARDLSNPLDERRRIENEQKKYRENNEKARESFVSIFEHEPKRGEFEKYILYREQQCKCIYSGEAIDLSRLLEPGYVEVDHALPYSRSFDDSKNNKVLARTKSNRDKGNLTPYEYLDGKNESDDWRLFVAAVESNKNYRQAKRNRLLKKFGDGEAKSFKERNLSDTRYIARFFKNYVEQFLQLAGTSEQKRCVVLSGQLTAFLRRHWGLVKNREESDRHHALDAVVVAACSHSMVKRLSDYSRQKSLAHVQDGFFDVETGEVVNPAMRAQLEAHFPDPWPNFRQELLLRLTKDDPEILRLSLKESVGTYSDTELASVKPLFVSRAPRRRNSGAAHKETIYSQPPALKAENKATEKVKLQTLTKADIDDLIEPHRNERLYTALRQRLEAFGDKPDKAFAEPFHKPDKNGNLTGSLVHTVTKVIEKISGIPVREGIARNDSMIRVDVFAKEKRFYLVPVYVHHRVAKKLPDRAIVGVADESEWDLIDDSFIFRCALYQNDLVQITLKKGVLLGYYAGCDRSTGAIHLWAHDRNSGVGKEGLIRSIGVKTAISIDKLHVDVLGNIHKAQPEQRHGLA